MSGSSGSPVVTQTQNQAPWAGAQPYLSDIYSRANVMMGGNVGYTPYGGPTVAPLDPSLAAALGNQRDVANWAYNQQFGIGGESPLNTAYNQSNYIMQLAGLTPGVQTGLGNIGQAGTEYANLYNQNIGAANPYLQAEIDAQNRLATERVQSSMSGAGRYGSALYNDAMARAQAEVADPILAQDYMQRQQLAGQAAQGLAQTGAQYAGITQQGISQMGQYAQMAPGLINAFYAPGQTMTDIWQYFQGRAQQDLQGQIAYYNALQAYPWQELERNAAIMAGAGQLGGTTVTSQTPMQAPLTQRLLGGALVGGGLGSAIPGIGTGLGALGGAGLGAFL